MAKHCPSGVEPWIPQTLVAIAVEICDDVEVRKVFTVGVWITTVKILIPLGAGASVSVLLTVPEYPLYNVNVARGVF